MKKLLILISIFIIQLSTLIAQDTFVNSYPYEDLWPPEFNFSNAAYACNVIPAIGGGYLLQAFVEPYLDIYSEPQCMFWKISEEGVLEWRKNDFFIFGYDYFRSIVSNGVDRYYAISSCGWLGQQTRLYILDENCDLIDIHPYWTLDTLDIKINSMQILDDGLIMAGRPGDAAYAFIMKTDFDGNPIWTKDGSEMMINGEYPWELNSVITTSDNGFLACGYQESNPGTGYLMKFDAQGDTLWTYHQVHNHYYSVLEFSNDLYYIANQIVYNSEIIIELLKFNNAGVVIDNYYTMVQSDLSIGTDYEKASLFKTNDNNLLLLHQSTIGEIIKLSPQGDIIWSQDYIDDWHGLIGKCFNRGFIEENGSIVYCARDENGEPPEILLIKTDAEGIVSINNEELIINNFVLSNYPNPFNPTTIIKFELPQNIENAKLEIYNIRGQLILSSFVSAQDERFMWNAENCASGIYFYRIVSDNFVSKTNKMLLIK